MGPQPLLAWITGSNSFDNCKWVEAFRIELLALPFGLYVSGKRPHKVAFLEFDNVFLSYHEIGLKPYYHVIWTAFF